MKKLTIRKIIEIIFCCMAILGSCGILKPAFSDSVYGGIAAIGIILANLGLITLAIFRKGYGYHKLLLALEFVAFCFLVYFSTSFLDNSENIFTQLLIFGGFCSWLVYVGIKYFLSLFLIPFKILGFLLKKGDKKKGVLVGTKWICDNYEEMPSGKLCYCHHKIITFKNGTPSPIAIKGCEFSNDGKHHFVPIGAERNVDSSVRNAIEWIGFAVGIIAGLSCFIMKIIQ